MRTFREKRELFGLERELSVEKRELFRPGVTRT